jgi:hypothetical protein
MKFAYTTLQSVRDFGISSTDVSDDLVRKLIPIYSDRVNTVCGQIFAPLQRNVNVNIDGGSNDIHVPGSPIVKINSINFTDMQGNQTVIDPSNYALQDNNWVKFFVKQVNDITLAVLKSWYYDSYYTDYSLYGSLFLDGKTFEDYLILNCIIGNIENNKDIVVNLSSPITTGTTSFTITDASVLEPGDVFVFNNNMLIADSIDYATNTITIDQAPNMPTIPSGSTVEVYGRTPLLIEQVLNLFIKHHENLSASQGGTLRRERIGSWFNETSGNTTGMTGINEIDNILYLFTKDDIQVDYL